MSDQVNQGSSVKSLGSGRFGGLAIPFGPPKDCVNDVFDYLDLERLGLDDGRQWITMLLNHGADKLAGKRRIAKGVFDLRSEGLWLEWSFENLSDPVITMIRDLADDGALALSSSGALIEREAKEDYYLIKRWAVIEVSCTSSPCAVGSRTAVTGLKDFQGLSLEEMNRRRGMSASQLAREENTERRYRLKKMLGEPLTECEEKWQRDQLSRCVSITDDHKKRWDINLTMDFAQERLKEANHLYAEAQKLLSGAERESAASVKFRHVEDWLASGRASFGCGFLGGRL